MRGMLTPLQYGDPPRLGPFVLRARLRSEPAGLVYLGEAPDGREVAVAVLNTGAARDPAARGRFVAALREAARIQRGGPLGWGTALAGRLRGRPAAACPEILAMDDGDAPWVAVPYLPGEPGAERFLEQVVVSGMLTGERTGPDFVPYWTGHPLPALPAPPPPPPPPVATQRAVLLASALLTALVAVLILLLWLMFRTDGEPPPPRPLPATNFVPTPPPQPASPEPGERSPSPSPSKDGSASPTPVPGESEEEGAPI